MINNWQKLRRADIPTNTDLQNQFHKVLQGASETIGAKQRSCSISSQKLRIKYQSSLAHNKSRTGHPNYQATTTRRVNSLIIHSRQTIIAIAQLGPRHYSLINGCAEKKKKRWLNGCGVSGKGNYYTVMILQRCCNFDSRSSLHVISYPRHMQQFTAVLYSCRFAHLTN